MNVVALLEQYGSQLLGSVDAQPAAARGPSELRGRAPEVLASLGEALRTGIIDPSAWKPLLRVGVDAQRLNDELLILQRSINELVQQSAEPIPTRDLCLLSEWFSAFFVSVAQVESRRFKAMLDTVVDHVALGALDGQWAFANAPARRDVEAVVGKTVELSNLADHAIFAPVARQLDDDTKRALGGERVRSEVQFPTRDGWRWREQHVRPLCDRDGRVEGVLFCSRDVHARKIAHEQLAQEAAFREEALGVLSHDLRNPIAAVQGLAGLVRRDDELPSTVRARAHHIEDAARRMTEMIQTLDFAQSRFQEGLAITRQETRLDTICRAIVDELRLRHPRRELRFEVTGEVVGFWDPDRLAQVVSQLVGNAIELGDPLSSLTLQLGDDGDEVTIEVTSGGPPIPEPLATRIFEPLRPGAGAMDKRSNRVELGLHIVRQIVDAHRGRISVRSGRDYNCFVVRLAKLNRERAASKQASETLAIK